MPAKHIANLLNSSADAGLGDIVARARRMGELTTAIRAALPAELGESIRSASVREDGTLVVFTASSAWAARLRFEAESLVAAAVEAGVAATGCAVRVSHGAAADS